MAIVDMGATSNDFKSYTNKQGKLMEKNMGNGILTTLKHAIILAPFIWITIILKKPRPC